jgi:hypothetical protein
MGKMIKSGKLLGVLLKNDRPSLPVLDGMKARHIFIPMEK